MRYLALTITINGEIPKYNQGLMNEITDFFVSKGYHLDKIDDQTTRPKGFYLFETNHNIESLDTLDEFYIFLYNCKSKEKGMRFRFKELKDANELGFLK